MYVIIILMQVNEDENENNKQHWFNDENNKRIFCVLIEINFHFGVCYKE